jgi:hypothetical protein
MSTHIEPRYFDLNTADILEDWEPRHAVRELIANALDEQAITSTRDIEIERVDDRSWRIRDYGRGLSYDHLLQNESEEKRLHANKVIGKFGFGLKDALATLHRRGIGVSITSRHSFFQLDKRAKPGFADVPSLHVVITPSPDAKFAGTEIVLSGVASAEIEAAKLFFLRFSGDMPLEQTPLGQILMKPQKKKARIYLKGLFVAEEENFLFSYNITSLTKPMEKALNRERSNVGRAAYSERVKEMLLKARSAAVADPLGEELPRIELGRSCDEIKWQAVGRHAIKILSAQGNVMFIAASKSREHLSALEDAEADGYRLVTVPDSFAYGMEDDLDLNGQPIHTVIRYIENKSASFQFDFVPFEKLRKGERAIFEQRHSIAKLVGGLPKCVKGIEITLTMRPDVYSTNHTQGLWEPALGKIIIHRDELRSLPQFAGTLLHEIGHARTGYDDITRDFENELTDMLGFVAARTLGELPAKSARKSGRSR